jgi:hypothetical protein
MTSDSYDGGIHHDRYFSAEDDAPTPAPIQWRLIDEPTADVTGDLAASLQEAHGAYALVERYPADPDFALSRDVLVYMNEGRTRKVVLFPTYDSANGEHYTVSAYVLPGDTSAIAKASSALVAAIERQRAVEERMYAERRRAESEIYNRYRSEREAVAAEVRAAQRILDKAVRARRR